MEQSKWQLILHEQHEDPYFEITNGPISLCCNAGFVGEMEDEEDAIFKKVTDALNSSGIDFHSENPLELKQHIEIQELQAKCERYETALKKISDRYPDEYFAGITARKALSAGVGEKEVALSCMVCESKFMGPEPKMCCNGSDCGCLGQPIDPIVCSEECYNHLTGNQKEDQQ